ncbi:MAG: hypothetical protein JW920_03680 [Deltaproteobacteria bacterium]|nr:hypothetical protein [Deltaproteobacteria bacterium]
MQEKTIKPKTNRLGTLVLFLIVVVLIIIFAPRKHAHDAGLDIRYADDVPVLWQNNMPCFTRFQGTDHTLISLDGIWKFQLDPGDQGIREQWFQQDLDERDWVDHPVPGCWNTQRPEWLDYVGAGWYRRKFVVPASLAGSFNRLVLDGVSFQGDVYLNGTPLGSHSGGFTQWCLDAGGSLKYGVENTLAIRVDNRRDYETLPPLITKERPFGWWPYGGLNRSLYLESSPRITLCKLALETDHKGRIAGDAVVYNNRQKPDTAGVEVKLFDRAGNQISRLFSSPISIDSSQMQAFRFEDSVPGVQPWSPTHPGNRYSLEVSITTAEGSETQSLEIGFRKFEFKGPELYFNGKPFFMRGVNRHEDDPATGLFQSDGRIREDMDLLHDLHVNFVRTSHNPNDVRWLDACDREGMLLVEEIPLYQVGWGMKSVRAAEKNRLFFEAARELIEMIERDRNHPSIAMWSIGDECFSFFPSIKRLYKRLYSVSKTFDPRTPVTFAIFSIPFGVSPALEISAGIADAIFVNEYFGWYFAEPEQVGALLDSMHKKWPDKPLVVSEFGAGSLKGSKGGKLYPVGYGTQRDFAEAYQAHFYQVQLDQILKRSFVVGTIPWVFADFRDDKRFNNPEPDMNLKGLLTYERQEKQAYDVISDAYSKISDKFPD